MMEEKKCERLMKSLADRLRQSEIHHRLQLILNLCRQCKKASNVDAFFVKSFQLLFKFSHNEESRERISVIAIFDQ